MGWGGTIPPLRGIVVAATGNGSLHKSLETALTEARAKGVQVRKGTRCAKGRVYASPGDWPDTAGLSPVKARLALCLELLEA